MHTIETINYIIMCLFFMCYAYQFAYIPLAWLPARKRQTPKPDPDHTFAVLIAAHDEATVIGTLVDSLCAQTYPAQQIGIFVAADRCSDRTAEIARAHSAAVFARSAGGRSAGDLGDGAAGHFRFVSADVVRAVSARDRGDERPAAFSVRTVLVAGCGGTWGTCGVCGCAALHPPLDTKAPGAVTYAGLGMMLGTLYSIVVGTTTLKVPLHVMTLSDFCILWFVLGIAVMLGLEALKKHMQKVPVH